MDPFASNVTFLYPLKTENHEKMLSGCIEMWQWDQMGEQASSTTSAVVDY